MNLKERYKLNFEKNNIDSWGEHFRCYQTDETQESFALSTLLTKLNKIEARLFSDEIQRSLNGESFEENYVINGDISNHNSIEIIPPNAVIDKFLEISLLELKELLNDWINFS